jgi:nitroreductase
MVIFGVSMRHPDHPIDPRFLQRWSPRALSPDVSEAELLTCLEAARWAPSSSNSQPWRYVVARAGEPGFDTIFQSLVPFNQSWAGRAGALIAACSLLESVAPGAEAATPLPGSAFDAGAAWMSLALQAQALGLVSHAMGGFKREQLAAALRVPASARIDCVIALGRPGDPSQLGQDLQAREHPNGRRPLAESVMRGVWA